MAMVVVAAVAAEGEITAVMPSERTALTHAALRRRGEWNRRRDMHASALKTLRGLQRGAAKGLRMK